MRIKPQYWKEKYEECDARYTKLYGENQELAYELDKLRMREEHFASQDAQIRALHEQVRRLKHDMKNHMLVLASYLNDGEVEAAKNYTSEILDKLNAIHSYIETDNSLLNHILNQKLETARQNQIQIKAEIENLGFAKLESMDFTALLSNMLDNAIEACLKEEVREMHVTIGLRRGYEAIIVKNRIGSSVLDVNPGLVTNKEEAASHGMGVGQIKALVEKSGGICDFYEEDGFFTHVRLSLNKSCLSQTFAIVFCRGYIFIWKGLSDK